MVPIRTTQIFAVALLVAFGMLGPTHAGQPLISQGSEWSYLDDGADEGPG